jgi:hypothetical protein
VEEPDDRRTATPSPPVEQLVVSAPMNGPKRILLAVLAVTLACTGVANASPHAPLALGLDQLTHAVARVLPESWRITESGVDQLPIGWAGPATGLYVMVEDTNTRFFHPSGFHYYSFYRIWLMPPGWEGEMRRTPYVADSAPAFLLGLSEDYVALYHTAGGNVWPDGPAAFCSALKLDTIKYTHLTRRVVDLEIEERLTEDPAATGKQKPARVTPPDASSFVMSPYRIVGLAGEGPDLYLEYVFGNDVNSDGTELAALTEQLAGDVFEKFPEVESLYLRRCTRDTFTDTIVSRD